MIIRLNLLVFLLSISSIFYCSAIDKFQPQWAVVNKNVVDAVPYPMTNLRLKKPISSLYEKLPYAPQKQLAACPRLHQLLFNEIVNVVKKNGVEIECEVLNFFYHDNKNQRKTTLWLKENDVTYLNNLKKMGSDLKLIPEPYCYTNYHNSKTICKNANILTLAWPYFDQKNGLAYSAGTRFTRLKHKDKKHFFAVGITNLNTGKSNILFIPKAQAVVNYSSSQENCIRNFVNLIRKWISNFNELSGYYHQKDKANKNQVIPYVWGGSSFLEYINSENKEISRQNTYGINSEVWIRRKEKDKICAGFECSSLILRVAQIFGMPYFCKNTTSLSKNLKPLRLNEKIEDGDLLWYPGHVLIITDITNNLISEAVGYQFGYGCLHERPLNKIFMGVNNYNSLLSKYHQKKFLLRMTKDGKIARRISDFVIFKIKSIWQ